MKNTSILNESIFTRQFAAIEIVITEKHFFEGIDRLKSPLLIEKYFVKK
ncbi:MAG: hypothetical protein ACPG49_05400 [Chitinophagales bacterium]